MAADNLIAITGSTGQIGGRVARQLAVAAAPQRLIVRDASRAPELPAAEVVVASYDDQDAARAALAGCSTLFMVSAAESVDRVRDHLRFVDAAVDAGVERIVYLSFLGAAPDATFTLGRDHWATEQHIRASGLRWTFVRDSLYADFLIHLAGADGAIRGPAGDGVVAAVAQADVAEVATKVLLEVPAHDSKVYDLTGPEALSMHQIAEILSASTGRQITYYDETLEEAYASRASYGAPDWQLDAWVSTYTSIAAGDLAAVTDDVQRLTGHPATTLVQLLAQS